MSSSMLCEMPANWWKDARYERHPLAPNTHYMTPTPLATNLGTLGWSARHLARELGCSVTMVLGWARGRTPTPAPVASWVGHLAAARRDNPPPEGDWRVPYPRRAA